MRCLRQRLEESIRTNERLRQQLEERLATTGRDGGAAASSYFSSTIQSLPISNTLKNLYFCPPGAPTNIYIQGLDTVTQLSNDIRVLKDENLTLQSRLQASTGTANESHLFLFMMLVKPAYAHNPCPSPRQVRGDGAATRGGVHSSRSPQTSRAGGRAVEGGAEAPADSQSRAGTADPHPEAGATGQPGENQQVGGSADLRIQPHPFCFPR